MTPIHATDLIERCRTTPAGHLEAWSIQGRYGATILAFGAGLGLLSAHLMRSGSQAGWLWALCGCSVFALCFGIAICRLRETLRVDETGIHVAARSVFRTRHWHAPRAAVRRVLLREVLERDDNGSSIHYDLLLEVAVEEIGMELRCFRSRAEPQTRRMGAEVSRALQLPFVDAIGDKQEEVPHDATPLRRPEPVTPRGAAPERVHEDLRSGTPALMIQGTTSPRVTRRFRGAGWAFFALASLAGWAISHVMEPAWLGWAIPFPFWGASLYFLADAWVGDHSREHVSVRQGIVAREVELLGRRWRRTEFSSSELQHLRAQSESPSARGVALVSNDRVLVVGTGLEGDEIDWLHGWLTKRAR